MPDTATQTRTLTADSPAALASIVRDCAAAHTPLVDYGIAHQGLGNPPPPQHVRLEQGGSIIEHYERDFTVRAAAGIRLGDLQAAMLKTRQFVPVDADADLSLGEVINHHVYGGLRAGYGSIRDLLLGLRYMDSLGREIHAGGRTVKNVAGYDLTRFMVGSLGEFGVVYEATLRTYAVPEQTMGVDIDIVDPTRLDTLLTDWMLSDAAPACMTLSRRSDRWLLHLSYFGRLSGCVAQLHALEGVLAKTKGLSIAGTAGSTLERDLAELASRRAWRRKATALVKVVVQPAVVGTFCRSIASAAAASGGTDLLIDAIPVHGCVFVGADLDASQAVALDGAIAKLIEKLGGLRAWHARPAGAQMILPFAPAQPDWGVLRQLKHTMDPTNLFNPGRFLGAETTGT